MLASLTVAIALLLLGVMHLWWALAAPARSDRVIPSRVDGQPLFTPGPAGTLLVAALLFAAAFLLYERSGLGPALLSPALARLGAGTVAVVLLLRGIGDFRYVGLFKRERSTPFARQDTLLYTPLVLTLAALAGLAAWRAP